MKQQPRTALISVAAYYALGYDVCGECNELKPPEDFYEGRTVCKGCVSSKNARHQAKDRQAIVPVSVPGWGYRAA